MANPKSSCHGLDNIRYFVIFGDSYSSVGYSSSAPHPTEEQPLGVEFPGTLTWTTEDEPNWVGYLVSKYLEGRPAGRRPIVFDYAVGGSTLAGVSHQINRHFLPTAGQKPDWAPWDASDTLFITWVGINDCAFAGENTFKRTIDDLFEEQEGLYNAGARNFLFIDLPPINRSPAYRVSVDHIPSYVHWNVHLKDTAAAFSAAHPDVTAMLYSSWDTFTRVLDNPAEHGFNPSEVRKPFGEIWLDHLHPTSAMHEWIARDLVAFFGAQESKHEDVEGTDASVAD
ncbi:hypothetical protein OBBRIDRAFT_890618 [Obba rivulosa]|uniref:Carbohydrate esterase family 16 protein n=1 Tax=Obba rivulosa TaxID=1052685 RepID=A0A8E2AKH8_9APHY|nr:hypothetical protein OBBRIDRAFT_890618 [Obba rivulosa]